MNREKPGPRRGYRRLLNTQPVGLTGRLVTEEGTSCARVADRQCEGPDLSLTSILTSRKFRSAFA